jgi:hypothetical protein
VSTFWHILLYVGAFAGLTFIAALLLSLPSLFSRAALRRRRRVPLPGPDTPEPEQPQFSDPTDWRLILTRIIALPFGALLSIVVFPALFAMALVATCASYAFTGIWLIAPFVGIGVSSRFLSRFRSASVFSSPVSGSTMHHVIQESPNHALQRTAPCVTAPASATTLPPAMQVPRRTPRLLSLGSLDVVSTQLHQGALNVVAWVLVVAGVCSFIAAIVGLALVATAASRQSPGAISQELHGNYYVISHTKHAVWPFIALIFFSTFIAIGGYIHTDRFVNRMIQRHLPATRDI